MVSVIYDQPCLMQPSKVRGLVAQMVMTEQSLKMPHLPKLCGLLDTVLHACSSSTEAEAEGSGVQDQPGLCEALSQEKKSINHIDVQTHALQKFPTICESIYSTCRQRFIEIQWCALH